MYATTESEKERDAIAYSQLLMILRVKGAHLRAPTALTTANLSKLMWWSTS